MYRTTIGFHDRLVRGEQPTTRIVITTAMGQRTYGAKEGSGLWTLGTIADGSHIADGSITAGALISFLENSSRLLSLSAIDKAIRVKREGLLTGATQKQQAHVSASLSNVDYYFTKLIVNEPFLNRSLVVYLSFEDLSFYEALNVFEGNIRQVVVTKNKLTLEAVEE